MEEPIQREDQGGVSWTLLGGRSKCRLVLGVSYMSYISPYRILARLSIRENTIPHFFESGLI